MQYDVPISKKYKLRRWMNYGTREFIMVIMGGIMVQQCRQCVVTTVLYTGLETLVVGVYAVTKMFRVVPALTIEVHVEKCKGDCSSGSSPTTRCS